MTLLTIAIVVILITLVFAADRRCRLRGIPGPAGVFILGNTLDFGGNFCKTWLGWSKIYGPVFQLRVFSKSFVILNDKESIVECFAKAEAAGRVALPMLNEMTVRFGAGIGESEGKHCEEHRHFFLKAFKEFGMTKTLLEKRLKIDIEALLGHWTSKNGAFFELHGAFDSFLVNSVWNLMSSNRFSLDEGSLLMQTTMKVGDFSTWGRKFCMMFPKLGEYIVEDHHFKSLAKLTKYEMKFLKEHRRDRIAGEPRDILDMLLDKIDATADPTSILFYKPSDKAITAALRDVQLGATTTTTHSFEWTVIYGCHFPDTVRRLQAEIDSVIGPSGTPSLNHKEQMPYAEAFILEAMRMSSVLPIGVPHSAITDFEFRGAVIPKGTLIVSNLYGMNYDPEVWADPDEFKPERFLDAEGRMDSRVRNRMIPFGTGKRSCIGRVFSEDQTFLVVVSMYQKFTLFVENKLESMEGVIGITHAVPKGVRFRAVPR